MLLPAPQAEAFDWSGIWRNRNQLAVQALQEGAYARAVFLAQDPVLRGIGLYRQGEFQAANDAFSRSDSALAHYNRGNALLRLDRPQAALGAYERALAIQPGYQRARDNRQRLEEFLAARAERMRGGAEPGQRDLAPAGESSSDHQEERLEVDERELRQPEKDGVGRPPLEPIGQLGGAAILLEDSLSDNTPEGTSAGQAAAGGSGRDGERPQDAQSGNGESHTGGLGSAETGAQPAAAVAGEDAHPTQGTKSTPTGGGRPDVLDPVESGAPEEPSVSLPVQQRKDASPPVVSEAEQGDREADLPGRWERQQALEQWLRRVPDDAGGLLKELFRREHRRGRDLSRPGDPW